MQAETLRTMTEEEMARQCVEEIRRQMDIQGINASGRTSASLGYEVEPNHVTIFAEGEHAPILTLQRGSGPHLNSEPEGFVEAIKKWVAIRFASEDAERRDSIAWAVITKIRKEGTKLWRETRESGLPRDVYTPALDTLADRFAEKVGENVNEVIINSIDWQPI